MPFGFPNSKVNKTSSPPSLPPSSTFCLEFGLGFSLFGGMEFGAEVAVFVLLAGVPVSFSNSAAPEVEFQEDSWC